MKVLSLGDIARLAGYSRARIHRFAVDGTIPGKPIRKPPEGQFRYEDTPELRAWCEERKRSKARATAVPKETGSLFGAHSDVLRSFRAARARCLKSADANDGHVQERFLEYTRQFAQLFVIGCDALKSRGYWNERVKQGYQRELIRVFKKLQ